MRVRVRVGFRGYESASEGTSRLPLPTALNSRANKFIVNAFPRTPTCAVRGAHDDKWLLALEPPSRSKFLINSRARALWVGDLLGVLCYCMHVRPSSSTPSAAVVVDPG